MQGFGLIMINQKTKTKMIDTKIKFCFLKNRMDEIKYTQEYIRANADYLDWETASRSIEPLEVPREFLLDYIEDWKWYVFIVTKKVDISFLTEFFPRISDRMFTLLFPSNPYITEELFYFAIDKGIFEDHMFSQISSNYAIFNFSPSFFIKNNHRLNWENISSIKGMPESFMRRHIAHLRWPYIFREQKLSKEFIFDFKHLLNFDMVIKYQKHITRDILGQILIEKTKEQR